MNYCINMDPEKEIHLADTSGVNQDENKRQIKPGRAEERVIHQKVTIMACVETLSIFKTKLDLVATRITHK